MKIAFLLTLSVTMAWGLEPPKLLKLRNIFQSEEAKAMTPLLEGYARALEKEEREHTVKGDLDSALAFRKERTAIEKQLEGLMPDSDTPKESQPAKEEALIPAIVDSSNPRISRVWQGAKGMKLTRPFRTLTIKAQVDGETMGEIILQTPGGKRLTIYSWTGNEAALRRRKKEIRTLEDITRSLKIDVSDFTKEAGDYTVYFHHKRGDGSLSLYNGRMDY